MKFNFKANIALALAFLVLIIGLAYVYNASVTKAVIAKFNDDRALLGEFNEEIVSTLRSCDSTDAWSSILEEYDDLALKIRDENGTVVVSGKKRSNSIMDARQRTPFEFKGKAYLLVTSIYWLQEYRTPSLPLVRFFFVEFLICLLGLLFLIFLIYSIMLRPFRKLYYAMESYEKGDKLPKQKLRGYIGKIYSRFVQLTRHLDAQQQNQQQIIASISHDIKTPLTSGLGYAERLQKDEVPDERRRMYLETIYAKAQEIRDLTDEFDEYLSYRMLKELHSEAMPTTTMETLLRRNYGTDLELIGVRFVIRNLAPKEKVLLDQHRMSRVFGNLISNSVKHFGTEPGLIEIEISADKEQIHINVSDNGTGLPEDQMELIFEPLYTTDKGRKVAGLGLTICREVLESMKGSIHATSSKYGGLCICMTLPKAKDLPPKTSI